MSSIQKSIRLSSDDVEFIEWLAELHHVEGFSNGARIMAGKMRDRLTEDERQSWLTYQKRLRREKLTTPKEEPVEMTLDACPRCGDSDFFVFYPNGDYICNVLDCGERGSL